MILRSNPVNPPLGSPVPLHAKEPRCKNPGPFLAPGPPPSNSSKASASASTAPPGSRRQAVAGIPEIDPVARFPATPGHHAGGLAGSSPRAGMQRRIGRCDAVLRLEFGTAQGTRVLQPATSRRHRSDAFRATSAKKFMATSSAQSPAPRRTSTERTSDRCRSTKCRNGWQTRSANRQRRERSGSRRAGTGRCSRGRGQTRLPATNPRDQAPTRSRMALPEAIRPTKEQPA